ncbi:MAG: LytR C-terminal domain-containing protein [Acidimicrobiales bacterium]|jgi:hypothetical protein
MSDHTGDPLAGAPEGDGRAEGEPPGHTGPSHWLRGVGVVIVAVVIGIVLLPSATRAPLHVSTASSRSPSGSTSTTTTAPTTTTTLPAVIPGASSIRVLVANATSISHLAAGVATYLHSRGYDTITPTNATTHVSATQVFAATGQQGAAGTVVSVLGLAPTVIQPSTAVAPVASTGGATVVVIAGPDLGRLAPAASSTTTAGSPG